MIRGTYRLPQPRGPRSPSAGPPAPQPLQSFENFELLRHVFARDCAFGAFAGAASSQFGMRWGGNGLNTGRKDDIVAQPLQPAHETVASPVRMQAIEVVAAPLAIFGLVAQNAEGHHQQMVRGGPNGFADAVLAGFAVEERSPIAVFLTGRRPGGLTQDAAQPAVALSGAIAQTFAPALVVAWTQPSPTMMAKMIARPLAPRISLATVSSLMEASSSTWWIRLWTRLRSSANFTR